MSDDAPKPPERVQKLQQLQELLSATARIIIEQAQEAPAGHHCVGFVICGLWIPAEGGSGAWAVGHGRHGVLSVSDAVLLEDAAVALRERAATFGKPTESSEPN